MSFHSKLFAFAAIVCLVLGFLLRGVETIFTVLLTLVAILLVFLSLAYRD